MRRVRVGRTIDLLGRFPRARVRTFEARQRSTRRLSTIRDVVGLERGEAAIRGGARRGFFEHPDCSIVFPALEVPAAGRLTGGFGVAEGAWDQPGDGVEFRVALAVEGGERVFLLDRYIDPKSNPDDRRWFDFDLDLRRWAGERVDVFFETGGGPAGDTDYDWAFWSEPRLVEGRDRTAFDFLERFDAAFRHQEVAPQTVHLHEASIGEDLRPVLFQHPTSEVRYAGLAILPGATLRFGIGIDPSVWDREGDGVSFAVWVEADRKRARVFERYIDPKHNPEDRRWFDVMVPLDDYAGLEIALEFHTAPGPAEDDLYDWALWSAPRIESEGREIRIAEDREPNFLFITVDTLRADHLGCYGNPRVRTPHLDALAARGTRFARAWCQSNVTIPSHVAMLSGRYPHHHILDNRQHVLEPDLAWVAESFQAAGYRTFAATSVHILSPDWTAGIDRGFDAFDSIGRSRRMGDRTAAAFREWLELHHQEPFFAWVHLFDPHAPYLPTSRFNRMYYEGDERGGAGGDMDAVRYPPLLAKSFTWLADVTDVEFPRAQYAAQVTHVDAVIGDLLRHLEPFGLDERTAVVVAADHGESLGEHGVHFNHFGLHDEVARVPLILAPPPMWKRPGDAPLGTPGLAGREVSADVMTMDLAPTLLELAGLPAPDGLDGRSLLPLLRGDSGQIHDYVVAEHTNLAQIMVVRDGWKYLRTLQSMEYNDAFSLREGEEALFDLSEDPGELTDRSAQAPERLRRLRERAESLLRRAPGRRARPASAGKPEEAAMLARLRDLGYL